MGNHYWGLFFFIIFCVGCSEKENAELELLSGYIIDLVASEPLIFDPVDLEFDHQGRAFVLEMPGYPLIDQQSRIILLMDSDQDGQFDNRQLFCDSLGAATSLMPFRDGFLVAAPPHVLFLSDRDGDEFAEHREIILSGFEVGNTQHNFNGLTYGLDNWIYGANGGNNGKPFWPDDPGQSYPLRGNDFRFKVDSKEFQIWGESSGGFELAMDQWGRIFQTHNLTHISNLVMPAYYHQQLILDPAHALENISDHDEDNGLSRIYPIGIQDTRVNHPEQSGYFSGACGITYYGGGSMADLDQSVLVADVVLNLVHRDRIVNNGDGSVSAKRIDDQREFLRSSDRSFRPVNMTVGPDGSLYLLDMHRQVIEHPEWIPDEIEKGMDLTAGRDKGRIYRIRSAESTPDSREISMPSNTEDLINLLEHPNQWWRLTSQRLLVEKGDKQAVGLLSEMLSEGSNPLGRVHALWTLEGMGLITPQHIVTALTHPHAQVRIQALKASESLDNCSEFSTHLLDLLTDDQPAVRLQAALTAGYWSVRDKITLQDKWYDALLKLSLLSQDHPWVLRATIAAVQANPTPLLERLLATDSLNSEHLAHFTSQLSIGALQNGTSMPQLLAIGREQIKNPLLTASMIRGIAYALNMSLIKNPSANIEDLRVLESALPDSSITYLWSIRRHLNLPPGSNQTKALNKALAVIGDTAYPTTERLNALRQLRFMDYDQKKHHLIKLMKPTEPWVLQNSALSQLSENIPPELDSILIALWPGLSPKARAQAGDILIYGPAYQKSLLQALVKKNINLGELNFDLERRRRLLFNDDSEISQMAASLFNDAGVVTREEAITRMEGALHTSGDPRAGSEVFQVQCSGCHIKGSMGIEVGPNLTEIHRKSGQTLLHDILDPNAAVENKYLTYTVETRDGEIFTGVITNESEQTITLRQQGGVERIMSRHQITSFKSSGRSYMPEGLENMLNTQAMADLLAFLQQY